MKIYKKYSPGDVLLETDYKEMIEIFQNIPVSKVIEKNFSVYFNSNVTLSRTEFKKQYPNKIVHDLNQAKFFISNNDHNTHYRFTNGKKELIQMPIYPKSASKFKNLNILVDLANNSERIIRIEPTNIKFESLHQELPEEMFEKIQFMLKSSDKDTYDLGFSILFQYDQDINRDKFLVLIANGSIAGYYRRKLNRVIEEKLKKLKSYYSNKNF